ncbi:tetratricopeptide repeat protein [Fluviicola taffensis]|uniref:Tetratricopeptide TPR_1 repeat-containing protein n=1 Tax=Fluviicola taffensis (strain DSM 16823 / NCIMB 13979 / RW262) TaxID=755732 RepID=F2IER3_FLUTR|nr:tetratricopeptide repeat protein [Fluviicola taffensis]AEA45630.1 Tetratricopeptide TPR_1 repeat-containing protein [Fluviicola taffensis DSM 16823]
MFDWEDDNDSFENHLNDDLQRFEAQLESNSVGFFDSDRLEAIIDHYLMNGNYSKGELAAEVGIQQYPFNTLFQIRRAQAMSGLGKLKEALELLDSAEKIDSESMELFLTKATIFSQLRDSKRAVNFFKRALELADREEKDEIFLDLATELEQLKDFKSAVEVLEEAMRSNPKNEGALYELAFCFDQLGDNARAINTYRTFLDENPYSFTAWYNLGNTYSKEEMFQDAITAYEYCTAINDRFSPAYFNMGNAQLTIEQYNESIESFERCIDIDGDDALTYCYLGEANEQLENLTVAWDFYQKALSLAPNLAEAWLGLGIVKDLQGHPKESLHYIERALEIEPEMDGYYHVYAGALENAEMLEEAEEAYLACLTLEPGNEDCYFDYVDFLIENRVGEVRTFVENFILKNQLFFSVLPIIYLNWISNNPEGAKIMLVESFNKDPEKTKDVFIRYPELADVEELVNLTRS